MKSLHNLINERYIVNTYDLNNKMFEADEEQKQEANELPDTNSSKYFFKQIIIFTNERDSSKNKTLKNLEKAIKGTDIEIIPFVADEVHYKATNKNIKIQDTQNKITIKEQSNVDTIVIARLGAQDSEECMECIKELQEWGFFVLNPIQAAKKASNKYTSAVLAERYNIPQPKFCLVCKSDLNNGIDSLVKKLKDIYPEVIDSDSDEIEKLQYVVKILNGHGGTGVFMVNHKEILAILQAIFAVDPERELLVQKKEEGDGGDIRVHVLTMRTEQKILAAMKRKKIGKDFRSNVSLGATAEEVELTKEQIDLALKVAKISGMPWCAVDIMPLVKGSNPEIGDNVILEWNASPGTDGISEVIGENFVSILLDSINNINQLTLSPKSVGYIEDITLTLDDNEKITLEAKLDTGNGSKASTIGCDSLTIKDNIVIAVIEGNTYTFDISGESTPVVGQTEEKRITVKIPEIQIGTRKLLNVDFALVDNRKKSTKILLNRDVLSKLAYMVNPARKHQLKDPLSVENENRRQK